jgi:thiol-disulfide isomerase/thioredoxin
MTCPQPPAAVPAAFLAAPRGLPYVGRMKHIPCWFLLGLALLAGCAVEEVEEREATGVLVFRAENAADSTQEVPGTLDIPGHLPPSFIFNGEDSLVVTGLPLDSALTWRFTPTNADAWFDAPARVFSLSSSQPRQAARLRLTARSDSTLSVVVRTFADGVELSGLPLWLDGVRWPYDSPATLHFSAGTTHQLESRNETCSRGSDTFAFADAPTDDLVLEVSAMATSADAGAADADLLVDGQSRGPTWEQLNLPDEEVFISAWRAGHRPDPPFFTLNGFCGGSAGFDWVPTAEGYQADQLFPDFTLQRFVPGQSESVGEFSLRQTRGRVVLVTFWFIDCPACIAEMPAFQDLQDEYGDDGFRVLALNPFPSDQATNYPDFDFTFLRDTGTPIVTQAAGVTSFPTNFILRPDGRIRSIHGGLTRETLEEILHELLP